MRSANGWLAALALSARISVAGATPETPSATARLDVRAAPTCTTRGDLMARVAARSPRIRFVDDDTVLTVRVEFTALREGQVTADIVMVRPGEKPSSRRLNTSSCAEAADGVALIIAVTLDPTSRKDTADTGDNPPPSSSVPMAERPASSIGQPASTAGPKPGPVDRAPAPPADSRRRLGAYVEGQALLGPAPIAMGGVAVFALLGMDRDGLWSPAILVGATHAWTPGLVEPGGTATFALDAALLDACALRLRFSNLEGRVCGSALAGILSGSGGNTLAPARFDRPFGTAGAAALLTAGLGSIVEVSARVGAGVTLVRDSFEFAPITFFRVAPITMSLSLGVGAHLP